MSERGFSLLEVLIALLVVSMLAAAGVSVLSSTLNLRDRFDDGAARLREIELAHATLRADLNQLAFRPTRGPDGAPRDFIFFGAAQSEDEPVLAFVRAGWDNPDGAEARGSLQYVEYWREDDALVRRTSARVDAVEGAPRYDRVVLTGIEALRVSFAQDGIWGDVYATPRDASRERAFPNLVALDLTLAEQGDMRFVFYTGLSR